MKVLVTGVKGQLGFDIVNLLNEQGVECRGVDIDDFDLTDAQAVSSYVMEYVPDVVIHCAAFTAVERAEEDRDLCYKVNVDGTQNLADAAKALDAKFVYFSTDYVFPGTGTHAYEPDDQTGPTNQYGLTKLLGEEAVRKTLEKYFICRISWVFGENGNNFIKTMLKLSETRDKLTVVADQIGSPTYCKDVAALVCKMITTERYGTYHVTNEGFCSWYDFACEIFKQAGIPMEVEPVDSSAYPAKVERPKNSRMSKQKLLDNGFELLPTWQDALGRFLKNVR